MFRIPTILVAAFALFGAATAFARAAPLVLATPTNVTQCATTFVAWSGGIPPYILNTSIAWTVAEPAGQDLFLLLTDSGTSTAESSRIVVGPSSARRIVSGVAVREDGTPEPLTVCNVLAFTVAVFALALLAHAASTPALPVEPQICPSMPPGVDTEARSGAHVSFIRDSVALMFAALPSTRAQTHWKP
ncbi:hypothetical protein K488DRAFT_88128 [Vararia minispora EC-137]|uniref:Uncharacterized protein n=1 Tax=Vararia minispora EC-137 TaxID=1314806 RepID=A0ACB8QEN4_9AGAM|nr:hypothetical protein K488DRAFT_88128 [Vararia minispora EC-137]